MTCAKNAAARQRSNSKRGEQLLRRGAATKERKAYRAGTHIYHRCYGHDGKVFSVMLQAKLAAVVRRLAGSSGGKVKCCRRQLQKYSVHSDRQ